MLYLFDNADAEAVVFHATYTPLLEDIRERLTKVKLWVVAADEAGSGPDWAVSYESIVADDPGRVVAPWGRSGDDLLLLYTGGTTGMPKGVMWRQDDLFNVLGAGGQALLGVEPATETSQLTDRAAAPREPARGVDRLPAHARHGSVLGADHPRNGWCRRDSSRHDRSIPPSCGPRSFATA
ncbi:MAG: AMP-binding protein [Ilumatobacteraceae bacterium]